MAAPPAGIRPIYVSNKQKEKYSLDNVSHKLFKKQDSLEEAATLGFYSLFHEIKADLQGLAGDEFIIVSDPTSKYGENFYFCLTEASMTAELQRLSAGSGQEAPVTEDDLAARLAEEAEAKRKAEEAELEALVVHEQPLPVRSYASETNDGTIEDVRELTVRRTRPLLSLRLQRRRYAFGAVYNFNDRESEAAVAEFRSRKEPSYDLKRKELDIGLQACASVLSGRADATTQTAYYPQVNSVIQCDMEAETTSMSANTPLASALAGLPLSKNAKSSVGVGTDTDDLQDALITASGRVDHGVLRALLVDAVASATALDTGTIVTADAVTGMLGSHLAGGRGMPRASTIGLPSTTTQAKGAPTTPLERLVEFLNKALPQCEHALGQNETLNIFRNELTLLSDEDVVVMGNSDAKHIREERQFMDLELSNNKILSAIEWHPKSASWLAVAAMPNLPFEKRVLESATPRASYILLYTLAEFSNQLVLEAPADVTCMHWNPGNPHLLAVGTITGHVAVFDMSEANDAMASRRRGLSENESNDHDDAADEDTKATKALHLKPKYVSAVEASSNRAVVGVRWLPVAFHLNHRNMFSEDRDGETSQFISATSDGLIAVWDVRFKERTRGRRRHSVGEGGIRDAGILQSALIPGAFAANVPAPPVEAPWMPQYRVNVRFGAGLVNITSFVVNEKLPSDPLVCGTEEGRIVVIDWAPNGEGTNTEAWLRSSEGAASSPDAAKTSPRDNDAKAGVGASTEEGDGAGSAMRVIWVAQDGERPPLSTQKSPFFSDLYLLVNDFCFSLWKRGLRSPVFISSPASAALTSGRWSPSRPGVLFIGRSDGVLEVWDILDSTIKPAVTLTLMSVAVTSMEFRSVATSTTQTAGGTQVKQLLAVGDAKGSLHVLDIPLPLRKGAPNEESLVSAYLEREVHRVSYVTQRSAHHDQAKAKADAELARDAAAREAAASKLDLEFQAAMTILLEKDPTNAKTFDLATLEAQKADAARSCAESKYQALERSIMEQLNVKAEDIVSRATQLRLTEVADTAAVRDAESREGNGSTAMLMKKPISGSGASAAKTLATSSATVNTSKLAPRASLATKAGKSPTRVEESKRPR